MYTGYISVYDQNNPASGDVEHIKLPQYLLKLLLHLKNSEVLWTQWFVTQRKDLYGYTEGFSNWTLHSLFLQGVLRFGHSLLWCVLYTLGIINNCYMYILQPMGINTTKFRVLFSAGWLVAYATTQLHS